MIVNDRITDYIQSLETSQGPVLDEIEKEALDQFVPIIRKETAAFLRTMTAALKPSAILEIGTAVGYSALQMCRSTVALLPLKSMRNAFPSPERIFIGQEKADGSHF